MNRFLSLLLLMCLFANVAAFGQEDLRLLVFTRTSGYYHACQPAAIKAVEEIALENGWELTVSADSTMFRAEVLDEVDVVIFAVTSGNFFGAPQREALQDFIHQGGGVVTLHTGTAHDNNWPWFDELVGARFTAHPAVQEARLVVEDRDHPATGHMIFDEYLWTDEWYSFDRNPREHCRVLLSVDEASYSVSQHPEINGVTVAMGDHPIAWCHDFEGGRSFQTALGHLDEAYDLPFLREHIEGGIRWAGAVRAEVRNEIRAFESGLLPAVKLDGEPEVSYGIAEEMDYYHVPGVSVAVIRDGRLRWAKGYGVANAATGSMVHSGTLFQAGSISKPVAALSVLKLADAGVLDLDADVNRYLKKWKVADNKFTVNEKVTLRRILTHTAGLTVHGFPGYATAEAMPDDLRVLNGQGNTDSIKVDVLPGSTWRYSGGGYTVMENLVEDVSGQDFASFMQREVLAPLGMNSSTYEQPLPASRHAEASAAYDDGGGLIEGWWNNYPEQAAAGLWTTPVDLSKYLIEFQDIAQQKKDGLLTKAMVDQMLTKNKNNWGLGPSLRWDADTLMFGHGGKNAGFSNDMMAYVYRGDGVVVMSNGDNGGRVIQEIYRSLSRLYGWPLAGQQVMKAAAIEADSAKALTGSYLLFKQKPEEPDYRVEISFENGQLVGYNPAQRATYRLTHVGNKRFVDIRTGDQAMFGKAGKEQQVFMIWGGRLRFDRVTGLTPIPSL